MTDGWRGDSWDRISGPHVAMGAAALDRLELSGTERVLDAGCGSGRLTEELLERLPRGHVIAVDGSVSMLAQAARRLERFADRVTLRQVDLDAPPWPMEGHVDAVLSTATFHWIRDHDALFEGLAGILHVDGQLSFQCGGEGNASALIEAARAEGVETAQRFNMAGTLVTRQRLEAHGFKDVKTWLEPRTVAFESREQMIDYIVTPYLRPATGLPEAELADLATRMVERLGVLAIDYIRLNVSARRG